METRKVLITGGCGFVGTAIISALLDKKNYSITAIDIIPPSLGRQSFPAVKYIRASVLDPATLLKVFQEARPDIVVHTVGVFPLKAARYSMKGKDAVFEVNVEGTRNVLEATKACGAKGLVYTSSVTVVVDELERDFKNVDERWPVGRAGTSYGQSKAIAESLVLSSSTPSLPTCALRPAPILGPGDTTCIPIMHSLIPHSTPFILGTGTNLQDYVYIANVADAHVLAITNLLGPKTAAGEAFFVTNGEPVSVRDLCLGVWKEFGHVPRWQVRVPEGVMWWAGAVSEWVCWAVGRDAELCRGLVSDGCRNRYVSIRKAREVLGYVPRVGLEEGIKMSCAHHKKQIVDRATRKGEDEWR